jgi:uncharacterized protein
MRDGHNRSQQAEEEENIGVNESLTPTIGDVIATRFNRRDVLRGALAVSIMGASLEPLGLNAAETGSSFDFREIEAGIDEHHHIAEGYQADILIRWGDPVLPDAPAFDPMNQSAGSQAKQFGYNNDFVGFFPFPDAKDPSRHGLLVVNHEYTNEELMFPDLPRQDVASVKFSGMNRELVDIEMMAHGGSVLEVKFENESWKIVPNSRFARRITAETPMQMTGPAAGSRRLQTKTDQDGRLVLGMLNNCAGGITPWGTWLTCEENINGYFSGPLPPDHAEMRNYRRMGIPSRWFAWGDYHDRFDLKKEPQEANRFGWVVEIDPFDPNSIPKKRTAMGRFKHEGAAGIISKDGHYVIYQGDDERFEYVYKFVTQDKVSSQNRDLLDTGTLHVARFDASGRGEWLPLVYGQAPLNEGIGFTSQADVVIEARRAADLLGATPMDRPEDVEANPKTGKVYVMLTNNSRRKPDQVNVANPRPENKFGHIIEITPDNEDHATTGFGWNILVKCGDPSVAAVGATFSSETTKNGWFGMPDNCAVDHQGRLWIATDGNTASRTGRADGLWSMETEGAQRGTSKLFFRCPVGAEMCGPFFTPDDQTLFLAVQHPGEADPDDPLAEPATFKTPSTRWPDFKPDTPPRPAVIVVTRKGGGPIG